MPDLSVLEFETSPQMKHHALTFRKTENLEKTCRWIPKYVFYSELENVSLKSSFSDIVHPLVFLYHLLPVNE